MGDIKELNPGLECDRKDCAYISGTGICAIIPSRTVDGECLTYTKHDPIEIELINNQNINTYKDFLEAQKMMFSLIPKSKQDLLYKGLKSHLEYAINRFVEDSTDKQMKSIANEYKASQDKLSERINYLEGLLDKAGIKHKITREDVYGKRGDNFCND